ncbi:MAG TPA: SGNH/GDSL hydrolase family protein [Dyella sp.]|uniref:SGNH/GDSL hydrolase family protein n=1 Tax=Dyella sp. TaxID=1869338 RepID=UPI002C1C7A08|nr:SGNH/GDSL hydrolase family protein [Dyella sp.]HUB89656.1 SGNH/GDSL hydrolase family protein [Dyella sp.]
MTIGGPTFNDQTIRMIAHASLGGSSVRVHLSNLRSTTPLRVGRVSIAYQADGASAVAGSLRTVTVSHVTSFILAAGTEAFSDPITMHIKAGQNVLISLYLPGKTSPATWHSDAFDTTYVSDADTGDRTDNIDGGSYTRTTTSWYYLSGVDVLASNHSTIVAFGDSITDGYNTPKGAYARWPDDLARRLADSHHPIAVVDAGLGGNRVLTDAPNIWQGISAIKRFVHDALDLPGVKTVILLEGINDIGNDAGPNGAPLTAQDLIGGYRHLIKQAHDAGIRIIGGTLLPDHGADYYTEAHEAIRQACNHWIRTSGAFDGVIDFDQAMRDPAHPASLRPGYDSGDHVHPNAAGMQAMVNAIDLQLLTH